MVHSQTLQNICKVKKTIESLVSDVLFLKKVNTAATQYGTQHETHAKKEYIKLFNCDVKKVGVIVCKNNPWLCASLDGVVVEDGCVKKVVEFKCPITCKEKPIVDYQQKKCNVNYLHA
ncbi:hypothetical protein TSAR_009692 [Trichomalopsis sarcophagae]|uniref:YqaJ viral recombinase domain-containing protein n=1 Tax=Trichomalopsis sarcophagae TaxID=543379 RepID=A0A232EZJ9_9HYME|nr:hypothetical protein TSAR_009692 [Trichomalopsis sarcophagae]